MNTPAAVVTRSLTAAAAMALLLSGATATAQEQPPNVVLIVSDDQSWDDYGFMNHPHIETPALDELASEGMTYTRGYVPQSLCRSSLMSLATGLYPHQHATVGNDPWKPEDTPRGKARQMPAYRQRLSELITHIDLPPTLPRMLRQQGYLSHQSGKWWEGSYKRGGFTHGMTEGFPNPNGRHGDKGLDIGRDGMEPVFDFIERARLVFGQGVG